MNSIKRLLYILFSLVFNLLHRSSEKKNRFLFVSFSGGYYDNLKYFDMYIRKNEPKTSIVWLSTGDMALYERECHSFFSLKGIKYLLTSNIIVLNGWFTVFSYLKFTDDVCIAQLWHGLPLRCIGNDDKWSSKETLSDMLRCSSQWSVVTKTCEKSVDFLSKVFSIKSERIKVTSFSRCDVILDIPKKSILAMKDALQPSIFNKIYLYAPTLIPYVNEYQIDFFVLNSILKKNNEVMVVKMHPNSTNVSEDNLSNIIFDLHSIDTQDLLVLSDCLITDYSSIVADFSLQNRAILYFCYDYEIYKKKVGLYIDIQHEFNEGFIRSLDELVVRIDLCEISTQCNNVDFFHDISDTKSSKRILEETANYRRLDY